MRKIIQIAYGESQVSDRDPPSSELIALCEDGTLWHMSNHYDAKRREWKRVPPIEE